MAKQTFTFQIPAVVEVTLDDSLLPDDEWRSQFYPLFSLEDVAAHIAYNRAANGITELTRLDGFCDRKNELAASSIEWEQAERI